MDKDEERDLAKRAKAGDIEARTRLIMAHAGLVPAIAASVCKKYKCWDWRDELLGEGYLALVKSVDKFDPDRARFKTFAYMKIESAMIGYLRSKWRRDSKIDSSDSSAKDDDEGAPLQLAADMLSPEQTAEQQRQKEAVQCAMQELSERQRRVVTLFYFAACSVEEIAEELGIPIGTVKSDLSRARKKMRKHLQDWR